MLCPEAHPRIGHIRKYTRRVTIECKPPSTAKYKSWTGLWTPDFLTRFLNEKKREKIQLFLKKENKMKIKMLKLSKNSERRSTL